MSLIPRAHLSDLLRHRVHQFSQLRSIKTSGGVIRIVKPPMEQLKANLGSEPEAHSMLSVPLATQVITDAEKIERVGLDVRVSDLFRQYESDPQNKAVVISVLQGLSVVGVDQDLLLRFPGFHSLVKGVGQLMENGEFSFAELIDVVNTLKGMGLSGRSSSSPSTDQLSKGLSNQLALVLDTMNKRDLLQLLNTVAVSMRIELDEYFYWCLDKELTKWALNSNISDAVFIRDVLGPLQILTLAPLNKSTNVLSNSQVQCKIAVLVRQDKLSALLLMELVMNLQAAGKSKYHSLIQICVDKIVQSSRNLLEENVFDLAVLAAALPDCLLLRESALQREMESLLLHHLRRYRPEGDSEMIAGSVPADSTIALLECVSNIAVVDSKSGTKATTFEILSLAAPIVEASIAAVNRLSHNAVARLYHMYASAYVNYGQPSSRCDSSAEDSMPVSSFLSVCSSLHGPAVGSIQRMNGESLARLAQAFGSGIGSQSVAFGALAIAVRKIANSMTPSELVNAMYGLAYAGSLSKAIPAKRFMEEPEFVNSVPVADLGKLAWSLAVADFFLPAVWDRLVARIEAEVLQKPKMLESLSTVDSNLLYEALVAARVVLNLDEKSVVSLNRRILGFQKLWECTTGSNASQFDYPVLLKQMNLEAVSQDTTTANNVVLDYPFSFVRPPCYVPKYKLVMDATKNSIIHRQSGHPLGSAKLRHLLWTKLRLNVVAVADADLVNAEDGQTQDASQIVKSNLGGILSQFLSELDATKQLAETAKVPKPTEHWESRRPALANRRPENAQTSLRWDSRPVEKSQVPHHFGSRDDTTEGKRRYEQRKPRKDIATRENSSDMWSSLPR